LNDDFFGQLDLGGAEPVVVVAGVVGCLLWLAAATFVYALRSPPRPPVGPLTLDLGPEPPAIANLLVTEFRVTDEAVPTTSLDLAARRIVEIEERGPDVFYVRLQTPRPTEALTPVRTPRACESGAARSHTTSLRNAVHHAFDSSSGPVVSACAGTAPSLAGLLR
jgi:hypothetical protein